MTTHITDYLQAFHTQHGEEAWRAEVQRLALAALHTKSETHEAFWRALTKDYDWLDWEQLKTQASAGLPSTDRLIAETIRSQMPGLKSQAQYDAVVGAMEIVQQLVNALLDGSKSREQDARAALELSLDAIRKATELTLKLEEVPEAASGTAAQQFKEVPLQFHEHDVQAALLKELAALSTLDELIGWYERTVDTRDKIVTRSLKNPLFDAIRAKRLALT